MLLYEECHNMNEKTAWTVLIYANGNNDLDTNIYKEFLAIKVEELRRYIPMITAECVVIKLLKTNRS